MGHGPGRTARALLDALADHPDEMPIADLTAAVGSSDRDADRGIRAVVARLEARGLVRVKRGTAVRFRDDGLPVYGLWISLPSTRADGEDQTHAPTSGSPAGGRRRRPAGC